MRKDDRFGETTTTIQPLFTLPKLTFNSKTFSFKKTPTISNMSRPDEEELVDYDEAAEETFAPAPDAAADAGKAEGDKKGSYVGIHSTGFR